MTPEQQAQYDALPVSERLRAHAKSLVGPGMTSALGALAGHSLTNSRIGGAAGAALGGLYGLSAAPTPEESWAKSEDVKARRAHAATLSGMDRLKFNLGNEPLPAPAKVAHTVLAHFKIAALAPYFRP